MRRRRCPAGARLPSDPRLLANRPNRRPLRRMLGGMVEDHPGRAFTQLRGMLGPVVAWIHPLSERPSDQPDTITSSCARCRPVIELGWDSSTFIFGHLPILAAC